MRLEYLCDEDGENGLCQHAVWQDLKEALQDLQRGQEVLQHVTRNQGGDQVAQGGHGVAQAITAIETAIAATVQGDLDWLTESWSQVLGLLIQEGEELLEEESQLDYVHPADVVALSEGAEEQPASPPGDQTTTVDRLLRNAVAVMHFVPRGGEQLHQLQTAINAWRQRHEGGSIFVDTQTTDGGDLEPPRPPDASKWVPPLDAAQWTGSLRQESQQTARRGTSTNLQTTTCCKLWTSSNDKPMRRRCKGPWGNSWELYHKKTH